MPTIDEILAAMPEEDTTTGRDYLVIDPAARTITVPLSEKVFGVEGDEDAARKYFICPRYVGDNLDLASMFLTVYYRNANGDADGYLVNDVAVNGDYVTFSWLLSPKAVAYQGTLQFNVCADLPNTPEKRRPDWNTTTATGDVLEGQHPNLDDVTAESSDLATQLRAEIAASTADVEAAGATQVEVVEAAGAAATADAQEQIEAKGAATLATIPADYTTMAGKVNEQANAIKGKLAGEIIQAGDVSPVEHYLAARVHGKNLFDIGALEVMPESYTTRISAIDTENNTFTITTADTHTGNGYCGLTNAEGNYVTTLRDICPQMVAGRTYVLSGTTDSATKTLYLRGVNRSWVFGTAMAITEEHLDAKVAMYGLNSAGGEGTGSCVISNLQIEEGTVATEYTPYIDPAGVTVTSCGKNLTAHTAETKTDKQHGLSLTRTQNSAMFVVDGTAAQMSSLVATSTIMLPPGTYTASVHGLNKIDGGTDRVYLWNQPAGKVVQNGIMDGVPKTFTLTAATPVRAELVFGAGSTYSNKIVRIQIEQGAAATSFEEYAAATAMPDESGTVMGLPSAAPTMTLLADTAGVTVECEYNRDSNAVYAELLAKIAALSG